MPPPPPGSHLPYTASPTRRSSAHQERHMAPRVEPMLERAADEAGSLARAEADQLMPKAKEVAMDLRDDATDAARVVRERATAGATEVSERARSGAEHVAQEKIGRAHV